MKNMNRVLLVSSLLVLSASACERSDKPSATRTSSATNPAASTTATTIEPGTPPAVPTMAPPATATAQAVAGKAAVTWKAVGLSTPESVLHDDASDVYLVSNIDGAPLAMDGKGFISKLGPDGTVVLLKWIEGGKNKVTLNAPKGMAFVGDQLYVADIDTVRVFDRKTGMPVTDVKIPGATFLNDVAVAPDGRVLVSDMGMKGANGSEPSGTDAVYAIEMGAKGDPKAQKPTVTAIAKSKDLANPNGLLPKADKIWVSSFGSNEVYSLDMKGKKGDVTKLPKGQLDGIVLLGDELLVSSWEANAVYRGKPGGAMRMAIEDVKSPADIGFDAKRSRVLVPLFNENEVRAYDMK